MRLGWFNRELHGLDEIMQFVEPGSDIHGLLPETGARSDAMGELQIGQTMAWITTIQGGFLHNDSGRYFQIPVQRRLDVAWPSHSRYYLTRGDPDRGRALSVGGRRHARGGTFFEPTVMTGVTREMRVMREETFGPVAPLMRFETEAEAIRLANDTESGLAAYFYSRDVGRVFRVAEALDFGMVGVNTGAISNEVAPFGGMKQSGIGREGSSYGIEEYLEIKYVCIGGV